jgi:Tfp pilus assembly protein PilO
MHVYIGKRDRIWLLGGLIAALLLVAVVWEFVISGQYSHTSSLRSQTSQAQDQANGLRQQNAQLKADSANLPAYQAALAAGQQALPQDTGMSAFLSELHSIGAANGVIVNQIQVGNPEAVTGGKGSVSAVSGPVYELPATLILTGAEDNLAVFLKQVQAQQPRAVLITTGAEAPGQNAGQVQLTLSVYVFVAPSDGATPSTD